MPFVGEHLAGRRAGTPSRSRPALYDRNASSMQVRGRRRPARDRRRVDPLAADLVEELLVLGGAGVAVVVRLVRVHVGVRGQGSVVRRCIVDGSRGYCMSTAVLPHECVVPQRGLVVLGRVQVAERTEVGVDVGQFVRLDDAGRHGVEQEDGPQPVRGEQVARPRAGRRRGTRRRAGGGSRRPRGTAISSETSGPETGVRQDKTRRDELRLQERHVARRQVRRVGLAFERRQPGGEPRSGPRPSTSSRTISTPRGSGGTSCPGAATTTTGSTTSRSTRTTRCSISSSPNGQPRLRPAHPRSTARRRARCRRFA